MMQILVSHQLSTLHALQSIPEQNVLIRIVPGFIDGGHIARFNNPNGLCIIDVADTGNSVVRLLDTRYVLKKMNRKKNPKRMMLKKMMQSVSKLVKLRQ